MRPYCVGGGRAAFHGNAFEFDAHGVPVITFRAEDRGEVNDLIAWDPTKGRLASWRGLGFCLGDLDEVFNPATYFGGGALWAHEAPLEWLLADCRASSFCGLRSATSTSAMYLELQSPHWNLAAG